LEANKPEFQAQNQEIAAHEGFVCRTPPISVCPRLMARHENNCTNALDSEQPYIRLWIFAQAIVVKKPTPARASDRQPFTFMNKHSLGGKMEMEQLTRRQKLVFEFIRDKIRNRGYGPTVREIGEHFDIASPNGVMCHLKALEKKGLISREPNMSRAIQLEDDYKGLPLAGRVAAGVMHEAIEQNERLDFDAVFNNKRNNLFALKVSGDSMIDAHIDDGDFVIIRRQQSALPGQIVVAQTGEGEATLKRYYPEKSKKRIRLQPANSAMSPIYVKDCKVLGIVAGVVRKVE